MSWVQEKIAGLSEVREGLWSVLQSYDNACKTKGAFYFLVPLPPKVICYQHHPFKCKLV